MDPLSEVLALLETAPHATNNPRFAGLKAGGAWAIRFGQPDGLKFNAVLAGQCWLAVDGVPEPVLLRAGDCYLLTRARAYTLASDLALVPVDAADVYRDAPHGIAHHGGDDVFLVGGRFVFSDEAGFLLDGLPPLALVDGGSRQAPVLRWALDLLAQELATSGPGSALMLRHLGHMMLVQFMREYQDGGRQDRPGWLAALSDARLHRALVAIHETPQQRWSVAALAAIAGMSRSSFALHFKQRAGLGPLEYVLRWRMRLACRALKHGADTVSVIGQSLGYDSDSAFSNAFKRLLVCSPRQYRARHHNAGA